MVILVGVKWSRRFEESSPRGRWYRSAEGVAALLVETGVVDTEDEGLTAAAEAVLLDLEEALAVRLRVLLFVDEEVAVSVDRVLDLLLTGEVAAFGDLADDEGDAEGFLAPRGDHLDGADLGHRVGVAVLVLAVIERLERVEEEEDLLALVLLAEFVSVSEDVLDHRVLTGDEAVLHAETLGDLADLEERFLTGVEEADVALCRDGVGELEAHGGLTGAGRTGEHHGRGGRHAFAADGLVEPLEAGLHRPLELGRYLEVEDVGAALPGLETDVQRHVGHSVCSVQGWLGLPYYLNLPGTVPVLHRSTHLVPDDPKLFDVLLDDAPHGRRFGDATCPAEVPAAGHRVEPVVDVLTDRGLGFGVRDLCLGVCVLLHGLTIPFLPRTLHRSAIADADCDGRGRVGGVALGEECGLLRLVRSAVDEGEVEDLDHARAVGADGDGPRKNT